MPSQREQDLQQLLFAAADEPIGLLIQAANPYNLKSELYAARRGMPQQVRDLLIKISPLDGGNLCIFKRSALPTEDLPPRPRGEARKKATSSAESLLDDLQVFPLKF